MNDTDWLDLCAYEEARGEINDGVAAVVEVILNRGRDLYSSKGSIMSTVTWPCQFSWCEFDMVAGKYRRVCQPAEVPARAATLLAKAKADVRNWMRVSSIADAVRNGRYGGGQPYRLITPVTLLYDNLALAQPAWSLTAKRVVTIEHHTFFEPRGVEAPARNWTLSVEDTERALA